MTAGLIVCAAVLAATGVYGVVWRKRNGALRQTAQGGRADTLTPQQLGHPLGPRATLVQFSSAFCAPCRATRRVLAEVAGMIDGVSHLEIDAESRLELVRSLGILATPTVFVLDRDGTVLRRGTGLPRKADVIAALGAIVPGDVRR
ncbi:MAG: thioredoxin family protein [Micromonosporaceae bacterium]